MRIGVSLRSSFSTRPREGARWMVERARASRDAGLDSLFVGDHHSTGPGAYYQNVPMMGRLLAEWDDRPAGALFLLPLWHPVTVAEQIGTLAALAPGRFVMQTAIGGGATQFGAMGVAMKGRAARFEAGLDAVRRLLAGEEVSDPDGRSGAPFGGARIAPVPAEPVEVWIGGTASPAIDRAARLGDAWLANADVVPDEAGAQADVYRESCAHHGRTPTAVAIRRDVHVGADPGAAAAVAEPVIASGYRGFRPEAFAWGSPEQVAEQFRALAAQGYTDVIVRQMAPEQRDALESIALLAEVKALVADA
ncbi:MAG TPA: LLM class flavin-dependent oxidoreductase [Acidimicrobiia bacterium]|nr:LLM class flavin-dependent oxidoreductase [Acidimicrobiia bacterium]